MQARIKYSYMARAKVVYRFLLLLYYSKQTLTVSQIFMLQQFSIVISHCSVVGRHVSGTINSTSISDTTTPPTANITVLLIPDPEQLCICCWCWLLFVYASYAELFRSQLHTETENKQNDTQSEQSHSSYSMKCVHCNNTYEVQMVLKSNPPASTSPSSQYRLHISATVIASQCRPKKDSGHLQVGSLFSMLHRPPFKQYPLQRSISHRSPPNPSRHWHAAKPVGEMEHVPCTQ